jgi:integrative and conjugative element protein (TIGR02256 family)
MEFWSADHRFGLKLKASHLAGILSICQKAAPSETGGILVGQYTARLDCALITSFSGEPPDSAHGKTWFQRGVLGLQNWLDRLWEKRMGYYLGEWHFHPYATPEPSLDDIRQMEEFAVAPNLHCPEPILLIIGGNPSVAELVRLNGFVFPRGGQMQKLEKEV